MFELTHEEWVALLEFHRNENKKLREENARLKREFGIETRKAETPQEA